MSDDWAFFDSNHPKDPLANQYLKFQYPVGAIVDPEDGPGIKSACRQRMHEDGISVETLAVEWDSRLQKAYNREQMEEAGCDDDVVEAATEDLEDSEEYEMFYDWLMKQCREVTEANAKTEPYFLRFVSLSTRDNKIVGKQVYIQYDSGVWTHQVFEEGKGSFMRQKSRLCEHTVTEGSIEGGPVQIQSRTKLDTHDKSRFFVITELAAKNDYRNTVELQEGVKANIARVPSNAVFKSKKIEYANQVEEEKVVR